MHRAVTQLLLASARRCFSGYALLFQCSAILITTLLVLSGFDWWYFEITRSPVFIWLVITAGLGGFIVPIIVPLFIYSFGALRGIVWYITLSYSLYVAELLAYLISILYKSITGRWQPNLAVGSDISHAFHFGFMENGIFWGWPSSHMAVASAGAIFLFLKIRDLKIRIVCTIYMLCIGLGASIGFHWLSDVIAGAIMGSTVAWVVYKKDEEIQRSAM